MIEASEDFVEAIVKTSLAFHNKFISPDGQHASVETAEMATQYVTWVILKFLEITEEQHNGFKRN